MLNSDKEYWEYVESTMNGLTLKNFHNREYANFAYSFDTENKYPLIMIHGEFAEYIVPSFSSEAFINKHKILKANLPIIEKEIYKLFIDSKISYQLYNDLEYSSQQLVVNITTKNSDYEKNSLLEDKLFENLENIIKNDDLIKIFSIIMIEIRDENE